jgi:hypothetical protein
MLVLVDIGNWGMTDVMRKFVLLFSVVSWVIIIISVSVDVEELARWFRC